MIRDFLELKYGKFVTDQLVSEDNRVLIDNINQSGLEEQKQVIKHLKGLIGTKGEKLVPDKFLHGNVEWGMDFSSWIGTMK